MGIYALIATMCGVLFILWEIWCVARDIKEGWRSFDKDNKGIIGKITAPVRRITHTYKYAYSAISSLFVDVIMLGILSIVASTLSLIPTLAGPVIGTATLIVSIFLLHRRFKVKRANLAKRYS